MPVTMAIIVLSCSRVRRWGEPVDVNLCRDKKTGKPRGFAFVAYEDQRSTVLAVDNFNGASTWKRESTTASRSAFLCGACRSE